MSDFSSSKNVLPNENVASLSGNSASYQSGGKKYRKVKNNRRTYKGKKITNKNTKKCWWKFW